MDEKREDFSLERREFFRRSGTFGIAGAFALGVPLLAPRSSAASLRPPRDVIAAGGGATVKIGHIDSFSGAFSAIAQSQHHGLQTAIDEANRKSSRIKWEIVKGDDAAKPATAVTEAKRLISQEGVDVLAGCVIAGTGLTVSSIASEGNAFFLAIGVHDTNLTGSKAHRVTFRQTCSTAMLAHAVGPELLKRGKKWYFLVADSNFGNDAYARLKAFLIAHGGQDAGSDVHDVLQTDYTPFLTKARLTNADVLVFCSYGPNTQNAAKGAAQMDLIKKMTIGGVLCDDEVAMNMPVEALVGSVWGYIWGPDAGGDAMRVYKALKSGSGTAGWRAYLGYEAGRNIVNRIEAAGTTDTEKLVNAFADYHYDAAKEAGAYFRTCDHQAVQQTYAAMIVAPNQRRSPNEFFKIIAKTNPDAAAEPCSSAESAAAAHAISSEKIGSRDGYTAVTVK